MAPRLKFGQPLSWRAGRPIAVGDLLKRLQALAKELHDMDDQEDAPKEDLLNPAKELASSNLLTHKDKGVRAWAACCLADILRVFAPEAPYTGAQLRDIFTLFVKSIIPALADPSDSYNAQHAYVLKSLSELKSVVLLGDVPSSSSLILDLFRSCFDILATSAEELSRAVEYHLTGVLTAMVDECDGLPHEVVDIVMAQFLHADPATRVSTVKGKKGTSSSVLNGQSTIDIPLPASYNLAKNLCNTCTERMVKYVSHYFSSIIMDASSFGAGRDKIKEDDGQNNGPSDEDVKQVERAHRLLRELWRACPGVLQNVIPQVEQEMSAENEKLRLLATGVIGDLASGIGAAGPLSNPSLNPAAYPPASLVDTQDSYGRASTQSFAQVHSSAYQTFLSRQMDKSASIRACWTSSLGRILATSAGGVGLDPAAEKEMVSKLSKMLIDSDDKVRIAAIETTHLFTLQGLVDKLALLGGVDDADSFYYNLADRAKDRKPNVRDEAIRVLGKIWGVCSGEIAAGNSKVKNMVYRAPAKLLNAYYLNDTETKSYIDEALVESLLPVGFPSLKKAGTSGKDVGDAPDSDRIRAQRLLLLLDGLDEKARSVFQVLVSQGTMRGPYLESFIKRCEEYNGGVAEGNNSQAKDNLNKLIDFFANSFPDSQKAKDDLKKYAKLHDRRTYTLIRFCRAPDSDYRKVVKSFRELERRLVPSNATVFETLKPLVLRYSNLYLNKSHIRPIIEFSQSNELGLGATANDMLKFVTSKDPTVFKAHAEELCESLERQAPASDAEESSGALDSLKACSSFAKRFPDGLPKDRSFYKAMMQYAQYERDPVAAKQAVTIILSSSDKKQMYAQDLLKKSTEDFEYGGPRFLTKLACLGQVMLLSASDLEESFDVVMDIAIRQVLNQTRRSGSDQDSEWEEEPNEECQAKLWALKILVNRLRHYDEPEAVRDGAEQTYQLLNRLVSRHGELSKSKATPRSHRARLQLQAANLLVKLSSKRGFDAFLSPAAFQQLMLTAQTPTFQVRRSFITTIKKFLAQDRLPSRFYCAVFLLAHDPDRQILEESTTWLRARAAALAAANARQSSKRSDVLELAFARFLSVLAHHPDFGTSNEDLTDTTTYLLFYLRSVATPQNISLIYHVAQRVKSVQDALAVEKSYDGDMSASSNLYLLSDLAQAVIRAFQEEKNWSMSAHPEKARMPAGIFKGLSSHDAAQEIATKNFLPTSFASDIDAVVRAGLRPQRKRKADADTSTTRPLKRRSTATATAPRHGPGRLARSPSAKRKRRTGITDDSDENDDALDDDDADGDAPPPSDRRQSGRASRKSYAETKESEDDEELAGWDAATPSSRAKRARLSGASARTAADAESAADGDQADQDDNEEDEDVDPDEQMADAPAAALDGTADTDADADAEAEADATSSGKENTTLRSPNDDSRTRRRGSKAASGRGAVAAASSTSKARGNANAKTKTKTTTPKRGAVAAVAAAAAAGTRRTRSRGGAGGAV